MELQSGDESLQPYITQTLLLGLELDPAQRSTPTIVEPKPRRQSLSQRLGFQSVSEHKSPSENGDVGQHFSDTASEVDDATKRTASPKPVSPPQPSQSPSPAPGSRQRAPKIECAEVCGNDVYIGTSNGLLVHYTLETAEVESKQPPENFKVRTVDMKLGAKRVEQMIAFPALCRLVVLCGSTVVFYSLPELRPVSNGSMPTIKGVSCIAFDERIQRSIAKSAIICVARMHEIHIYRIGADLKLEQEIAIENSVASICMYGNYVCLADTETYKILDLTRIRTASLEEGQLVLLPTQQPRQDPETGKIIRPPRPRTLVVGPNEFMFLTSSGDDATLGVIVTAMGEALRGTLQFSTYPKSVVYDEPYVIAVFGNGQVDVYDTRSPEQTVVQSFFDSPDISDGQRPRKVLMVSGTHISTSISRPEAIDTSEDNGSPNMDVVSMFNPQNLHQHTTSDLDTTLWTEALGTSVHWRRELLGDSDALDSRRMNTALSRWISANLVALSFDSLYILAPQPQLLRVESLIRNQRIEEAVLAVEAALAADASLSAGSEEISYCFQMMGMVCLKNMLLDDALQHFRRGFLDPRALLYLFPDYLEYLGQLLVPFGRISMAASLRQIFYEIGDAKRLVERTATQLAGDNSEQKEMLLNTLHTNTLEMLERYFEYCRMQMQQEDQPFAPDAVPIIDTALVRLYAVNSQHNKLCALIRAPNNNIVSDLACEYFMSVQQYYYCSLIYKAQGEVAKTLDIWRHILQDEWRSEQFGGISEYLVYLETIQDQQILLAEYYWLIEFDVGASLQVLGHLSDTSVASMDADKVIQTIQRVGDDQLLRAFIERLIAASHDRATHYMTYLLKVYVRQIRDFYLLDNSEARTRKNALETSYKCAQADDMSLTFRAHLRAVRNRDEGTYLRAQLIEILSTQPPSYDPQAVLECIENEAKSFMATEQAILLVVLNRAEQAVDLLVEYGDYAEAELLLLRPAALVSLARLNPSLELPEDAASDKDDEPADTCSLEVGTISSNVVKLLRMYLSFSESDDDMSARLVSSMLSRYASFIPLSILDEMPTHWPYVLVEPFVCFHLQQLAHREQASSIKHHISHARAVNKHAEYVDALKNQDRITLDYSQTCAKCQKLLGSSAFVYEPETQEVKHISCA
ncbi:hypothetical protein IWW36_001515 [Coemansia brasiliensis]|uniref:CNH domain-containing protein n=1 Tax=Coemansia brasiliensis TaxID=2650707 RepID=A0A9W8M095_9FUNG|nr:hypothetical protein IWW36_001515 [Coemansia brasiliensis]